MKIFWFERRLSGEEIKYIEKKLKENEVAGFVVSGIPRPDVIDLSNDKMSTKQLDAMIAKADSVGWAPQKQED